MIKIMQLVTLKLAISAAKLAFTLYYFVYDASSARNISDEFHVYTWQGDPQKKIK